MELWQAVTAVSGAVVALVVVGSAAIGLFNRPFTKLRVEIGKVRDEGSEARKAIGGNIGSLGDKLEREIGKVRDEGSEAHKAIGGNIGSLGDKLERLIDESSKRLEVKVDKLSDNLTEVQKGVAHIDGAMPHIEKRLGNLENRLPYIEPRRD